MGISVGNATYCTPQITANASVCLELSISEPEFWIDVVSELIYGVFGLPLNAWVLWLVLRDIRSRLSSDFFFLNLAALEVFYFLSNHVYWLSVYLCNMDLISFCQFSDGLIMAGQPLFQCCICVEQYLAVVHPIIFLKYKSVRYRATCSGAVWLLAAVIGLCYWYFLFQRTLFDIYLFITIFVAVLAVDLFCSFSILKALRQPGPGDGEREGMNLMKKRAFTTVLIILTLTVFCYLPFLSVSIADILGFIPESLLEIAYGITVFIFMSGSVVQPLLHLIRAGKLPCCRRSW